MTLIIRTEWERDDWLFMSVLPTCEFYNQSRLAGESGVHTHTRCGHVFNYRTMFVSLINEAVNVLGGPTVFLSCSLQLVRGQIWMDNFRSALMFKISTFQPQYKLNHLVFHESSIWTLLDWVDREHFPNLKISVCFLILFSHTYSGVTKYILKQPTW